MLFSLSGLWDIDCTVHGTVTSLRVLALDISASAPCDSLNHEGYQYQLESRRGRFPERLDVFDFQSGSEICLLNACIIFLLKYLIFSPAVPFVNACIIFIICLLNACMIFIIQICGRMNEQSQFAVFSPASLIFFSPASLIFSPASLIICIFSPASLIFSPAVPFVNACIIFIWNK